jgi:site-specific DNA recombinase
MKKVFGYIRASNPNQTGEDRYDLENQRTDIFDYCRRNDLNLVKWYTDAASGVEEERPELDKLLFEDEDELNGVWAVVVAKSDRLTRDINLYFYYQFVLKRRNIELISVSEDFGAMGVFTDVLQSLVMCIAEQERLNITKRTSGRRKVKARSGGYAGGRPPYGYKAQNGRFVVDEAEAEIVRLVFKMTDEGANLVDITDYLCDHGYRTRLGKRFYPSQVKSIRDKKPFYQGMYRYGGTDWVPGVHKAIL